MKFSVCQICKESILYKHLLCDHRVCKNCLVNYYLYVKSQKYICTSGIIPCPISGCTIGITFVENILITK